MNTKEMNLKSPARARYVSPGARIVETKMHGVLCASTQTFDIDGDGQIEPGSDDVWN